MNSCPEGAPSFPGCLLDVTQTSEFTPTTTVKREHPSFDETYDGLDVSPWQYLVKTALCRTSEKDNNHILEALLLEVSNILEMFKDLADKALMLQPNGGVALDPFPMVRAALCIELQCEMCVTGAICLEKLLEDNLDGPVIKHDALMDSGDDEVPLLSEVQMNFHNLAL